MSETAEYVPVATVDEVATESPMLVSEGGHAIALFHHEGEVRAVDNRCPHMGFPLTEGSVEDGILTCHWHHARFDLSCGDTFDPWADDVPTYPVDIRDGQVYVRPEPQREGAPEERYLARLETGLEENLRLVLAKASIGVLDAGVPYDRPFRTGLTFGTRYRADGWSSGLTIHSALANLEPILPDADRKRALYTGLDRVADDASGEPPKFDQPALGSTSHDKARLKRWFRDTVEVRDADGAERCLRTAIAVLEPSDVAEILCTAATDHIYLDTGHTFDFVNKAMEALDRAGWDHADAVLPSLVEPLVSADRGEERSRWRQPVDLAALLFETYERLPEVRREGRGETWQEPDDFIETLLGSDPEAIVDALVAAVREGATPEALAKRVTFAAGRRVAQFGTGNEFSDWNTIHHTYTYANAVHQATHRTSAWELYRGVLDAALNVYLDRFLNTPPAPIPDGDPGADPAEALEHLEETFEREGSVDAAGQAAADFLAGGGSPTRLQRTLAAALLREDAGFHTIQNIEVGVRQSDEASDPARQRVFLIAAARYLAAHTPTRREAEQTFNIATRLQRGERLHDGAVPGE
ncbi:MAG: Rieske 2Fe-2S domain-containing protein [Halodesulfurarchaeum sp.]